MTTHVLRTREPYFSAIADGAKTFEIRRNDRGFQRGDHLVLTDSDRCDCDDLKCEKRRPPIRKYVSYVFTCDPGIRDHGGILPGYAILALGDLDDQYEPTDAERRAADA